MDLLSATASVAGVLTLALQTLSLTKRYIDSVKSSESTASALIEEFQILLSNVRRLEEFLAKDGSRTSTFGQISMLVGYTSTCKKRLYPLKEKLHKVANSRWKQAAWSFSEKEHLELMQDLRAFSQWIQLSLSIDTSMLLSKSSKDILEVLSNQLKAVRQLDSIEAQAVCVVRSLHTQESTLNDARKNENRKRLLAWLSDHDPMKKHNKVRAPRPPDTGKWLFDTQEFERWYKDPGTDTLLWYHGPQGAGKSVLA